MPHSYGVRARTRHLYSKDFKDKGRRPLTVYKHIYKLGQYVDIVCDSSQHKGMPYKFYHGKTGKVWNVSKRAVGVLIKKVVGNREILKKIIVRVEHVRPSRCREDFVKRSRENMKSKVTIKRVPKGPKLGHIVVIEDPEKNIVDFEPPAYDLPY